MRGRILLLTMLGVLGLGIWLANVAFAEPEKAAKAFILAIRQGDEQKLAQAMEKGRWEYITNNGEKGLLTYNASEPQLAFLVGLPFQVKQVTKRPPQKWPMCLLPPFCKESAFHEYVLYFEPPQNGPLFLPKQMAFAGYYRLEMEKVEAFIKNPTQDYREGFTLRIRKSIQPNAIKSTPGVGALLPKARNAAPVVLASGEEVPPCKVEAMLPHLKSIILQLQLTRENSFAPWKVTLFDFKEAVVDSQGKEFPMPLMSDFNGY